MSKFELNIQDPILASILDVDFLEVTELVASKFIKSLESDQESLSHFLDKLLNSIFVMSPEGLGMSVDEWRKEYLPKLYEFMFRLSGSGHEYDFQLNGLEYSIVCKKTGRRAIKELEKRFSERIQQKKEEFMKEDREKSLLISKTEAGKILGVSRTTIWRMLKDGVLTVVKPTARHEMIRRDEVMKVVEFGYTKGEKK